MISEVEQLIDEKFAVDSHDIESLDNTKNSSALSRWIFGPLLCLLATILVVVLGYQLWLKQVVPNIDSPQLSRHLEPVTNPLKQQLQKYEKGINRISVSTLIKIASVLQRNISEFFSTEKIGFRFNDEAKDDYGAIFSENKNNINIKIDNEIRVLLKYFSKINNESTREFIISIIKNFASNESKD